MLPMELETSKEEEDAHPDDEDSPQSLNLTNNSNGADNEDEVDEEEAMLPLVSSSEGRHGKRIGDEDDDGWVRSHRRRFAADQSFLWKRLIPILGLLFLLGMWMRSRHGSQTNKSFDNQSNQACTRHWTHGMGWSTWKATLDQQLDPSNEDNRRPHHYDEPPTEYLQCRSSSSTSSSSCTCPNPYQPMGRPGHDLWTKALQRNQRLIQSALSDQQHKNQTVDVVLVGDAHVEHWLGTDHGHAQSLYQPQASLFQALFQAPATPDAPSNNNNNNNPPLRGLALGIDGDGLAQVLYRMQPTQELPPQWICPPVWWFLVGRADLLTQNCRVDTVVAGMAHLIDTVAHSCQNSNHNNNNNKIGGARPMTIVIHSLLPTAQSNPDPGDVEATHELHQALDCLARNYARYNANTTSSNVHVQFFSASSIFETHHHDIKKKKIVNASLFFPQHPSHPNAVGAVEWGLALYQHSWQILQRPSIPSTEWEAWHQELLHLVQQPPSPPLSSPAAESPSSLPLLETSPEDAPTTITTSSATSSPSPLTTFPDSISTMDATETTQSTEEPTPTPTTRTCTDEFTNGLGWEAWLTHQQDEFATHPQSVCSDTKPNCNCRNPFVPLSRVGENSRIGPLWQETFVRNQHLVQQESKITASSSLDFVFLGDSIVEHWLGTDLAKKRELWKENNEWYQTLFRHSDSRVHGLMLGIGGDRCPQLLYRLENGELSPPNATESPIHPSQIWILVGTNDLYDRCSVNAITAGILHMAQYIHQGHPAAVVVLHSILPREGYFRQPIFDINRRLSCFAEQYHVWTDFLDVTDLFMSNHNRSSPVNQSMYPDGLHPNGEASRLWGQAIVNKSCERLGKCPTNVSSPEEETNDMHVSLETMCPKQRSSQDDDVDETLWNQWMEYQQGLSHWCEGDKECMCPNPFVPMARTDDSRVRWKLALERNQNLVLAHQQEQKEEQQLQEPLEMVLMGDDLVEHWVGTHLIRTDEDTWMENQAVYHQLFRDENNALIRGLALGIAGDACPHLLYRLQQHDKLVHDDTSKNGSMDPALWWIVIGTNDLIQNQCSTESVAAAIVNVAQVIQQAHPQSVVILHSILPRGEDSFVATSSDWWERAYHVNRLLECYAGTKSNEQVEFFNATSIFLSQDDPNQLNMTLFNNQGFPNGLGSLYWGQSMVRKSLTLLGKPQPPDHVYDDILSTIIHSPSSFTGDESSDHDKKPIAPSSQMEQPEDNGTSNNGGSTTRTCTDEFTHELGWEQWLTHQQEEFANHPKSVCSESEPNCNCRNPLVPLSRVGDDSGVSELWQDAFVRNQHLVQEESKNTASSSLDSSLDFVFLGDSIVEHWLGTDLGIEGDSWRENHEWYQKLFRGSDSKVHGLTLGIGGDRCPQLLYRLENGELPPSNSTESAIHPSQIWILVGTSDVYDECSVNAITAGILHIAQYIHQGHPDAVVVLHSILPRGGYFGQPIPEINRRLTCFADSQAWADFLDVTKLFMSNQEGSVDESLYVDGLHPNAEASMLWGQAIVDKSLEISARSQTVDAVDHPTDTDQENLSVDSLKHQPEVANSDGDTLPIVLDPHVDDHMCTNKYTKGQGWEDWIVVQQQTFAQNPGAWCDKPNCECHNPFVTLSRGDSGIGALWTQAFERNKNLLAVEEASSLDTSKSLDMVLIGDSIVEHWLGTDLGNQNEKWMGNFAVYNQLFRSSDSYIRGMALGIGGDQCPQLLYRLQHGELPPIFNTFHPAQVWILVGTNDLYAHCSVDAVTAGIFHMANYIHHVHPQTTVVLHSILPRSNAHYYWWQATIDVNDRLACYASSKPQTEFFNATNFFLSSLDTDMINRTLMPDELHPNGLGSLEWGEAIVRKSLDLMGQAQPPLDAFDNISLNP